MRRRRGAPKRLLGVTIYHDFDWTDVFRSRRTPFKNGLSLARLAHARCPDGKSPALLLTVSEDAAERVIQTDDEYVVVVRIRHYLTEAQNDAAAAYYAQGLHARIAEVDALEQLTQSPERFAAFLENNLTAVEAWISASPERLDQFRREASPSGHTARLSPETIAQALRSMEEIPEAVWETLVEILPLLTGEKRQVALDVITAVRDGREAATATLGSRIVDRISDTRNAVHEYEELLQSGAGETALQSFIQQHPWMVGLDYVSVRVKPEVPRGQLDFCLERFDGFYDILELKSPQDAIVTSTGATAAGLPPTASAFKLGPALANALAQVHVYRDTLAADPALIDRMYGLKKARDPRLIIVIGQTTAMDDDCRRVLEQMNLSLHRVEIMPYDILGARAEGWLANIEHYLGVTPGH